MMTPERTARIYKELPGEQANAVIGALCLMGHNSGIELSLGSPDVWELISRDAEGFYHIDKVDEKGNNLSDTIYCSSTDAILDFIIPRVLEESLEHELYDGYGNFMFSF